MDIFKGITFGIDMIIMLIVLLVAGVYVVFRAQDLPGYAIYFYAFYALMVLFFLWMVRGRLKKSQPAEEKKTAKKKAAPAEKKPVAKVAEKPAAPAKKVAAK